jgi:hypothetical protein
MDDFGDLPAPLVGGHLDTVSFVMDYVEFRVNYNILRCMTGPIVRLDSGEYRFPERGSRDALCELIDTVVTVAELHDADRIELRTSKGQTLLLPLDTESMTPAPEGLFLEAVHLVPADRSGRPLGDQMRIW